MLMLKILINVVLLSSKQKSKDNMSSTLGFRQQVDTQREIRLILKEGFIKRDQKTERNFNSIFFYIVSLTSHLIAPDRQNNCCLPASGPLPKLKQTSFSLILLDLVLSTSLILYCLSFPLQTKRKDQENPHGGRRKSD